MLVDEQMRECVGFIGVDTDKGFRLKATCFFVEVEIIQDQLQETYVVASRHAIAGIKEDEKKDNFYIRLNTTDGVEKFHTNVNDWIYEEFPQKLW